MIEQGSETGGGEKRDEGMERQKRQLHQRRSTLFVHSILELRDFI
jgi:hypothetical protein